MILISLALVMPLKQNLPTMPTPPWNLDARYNYWGSDLGPRTQSIDYRKLDNDLIIGYIDYLPLMEFET